MRCTLTDFKVIQIWVRGDAFLNMLQSCLIHNRVAHVHTALEVEFLRVLRLYICLKIFSKEILYSPLRTLPIVRFRIDNVTQSSPYQYSKVNEAIV